jgi:hypothetical protein
MSDGDSTPIQTSLQMLRDAIVGGVEAVKATISRWSCVDGVKVAKANFAAMRRLKIIIRLCFRKKIDFYLEIRI